MGLSSEALRQFQEAVRICQEQGLKRESFDLLKRVAQLDPGNVPNRLSLADLLQREALTAEAKQEYESLLAEVEGGEDPEMVVRVCEHMMESFPDQESPIRSCVAAHIKIGQLDEAAVLLNDALPRFTDSVELRESLVQVHEARGDATAAGSAYREIAELYKRRGDNEKARDILQRFVPIEAFGDDRDPDTSPSLLLSDEAGDLGGDLDLDLDLKVDDEVPEPLTETETDEELETAEQPEPEPEIAVEVASDLGTGDAAELMAEARVSLEFGDPDTARDCVERALELDPDTEGARELLAKLAGGGPFELGEPEQAEAESEADATAAEQDDAAPEVEDADLAAAAAFEETLPDIELVLEDEGGGDTGFSSVEPPPELELVELEPSDPDAQDFALDAAADQLDDFDAEFSASELDEDLDSPAADEEVEEQSEPSSRSSEEQPEPELEESWGEQSTQIEECLEEAEFYLEQGMLTEAEALYRKVLKAAPQHPQANLRVGEIEAQRDDQGGAPDEPESTQAEAEGLGDTQVEEDDDAQLIAEEEFDLDAGGVDASGSGEDQTAAAAVTETKPRSPVESESPGPGVEAEELVSVQAEDTDPAIELEPESLEPAVEAEELVTVQAEDTHPSIEVEPLLEDEPESADVQVADTVPPTPPAEQPMTLAHESAAEGELLEDLAQAIDDELDEAGEGDDEGFDLAAELADDRTPSKGATDEEFQEIFTAFKKGIQEQVGEDEAEAHYDLAIAYKEMGLLSDAIEQLELVCRSEAMRVEGLALMATCELESGQAEQAAGHLSEALSLAGDVGDRAVALRYELGEALLAAGKRAEAVEAFEKVRATDEGFREVQARIQELTE
jgi:tetratricopeptide (TPR) repeat protein